MTKARTLAILFCLGLLALCTAGPAPAGQGTVNFSRPTLEGKALSLDKYRGRVVIIDVFATWCGPCKVGLPKINDLYQKYKDRGVSVIGYAVDKGGRDVVKPFAARLGLEFPVVLGTVDEAKELFGARVLPTTVVIDPQGKLAYRFEGLTSTPQIMGVALPLAEAGAPPPPQEAQVHRRAKNERRIREMWVTDNEALGTQRGLYVHVVADVADLIPQRGLWLAVNLQPEARSAGGTTPLGPPKTLYQRVDKAAQEYFILFVQCQQMPALPESGLYRTWVTLLGPDQKVLEESPQFHLGQACDARVLAQAAPRPVPEPESEPARRPSYPEPPVANLGQGWSASVPLDYEQTRGARLNQPETPAEPPAPAPARPPAPAEPAAAGLTQWEGKGGRIEAVKVTDNESLNGKPGLFVHVLADTKGLASVGGARLNLSLLPVGPRGVPKPGAKPLELIQEIADPSQHYYIMFVACDQLPAMPAGGALAARVHLEAGPKHAGQGESGTLFLERACAGAAAR